MKVIIDQVEIWNGEDFADPYLVKIVVDDEQKAELTVAHLKRIIDLLELNVLSNVKDA